MSNNKRRLSSDSTGEPKKTRRDESASQQDDEVFEDSGFNEYQDSDAYLCHTGASASCRENSSQENDIQRIEIDLSDNDQEGNSPSLRNGETDNNRDFCGNHLYYTIKIGEDNARQQKKEKKGRRKKEGIESRNEESPLQSKDIIRKCNALLNSGGGVLEMKIADPQHEDTSKKDPVDCFWQTIEGQLKTMILPSKYDDVFDRRVLSDKILLFINAPKHFCTMKYNLCVSGDSSVYDANYDDVVGLLKLESVTHKRNLNSNIQVPLKDLPQIPDTFFHQKAISLRECKQVQLKKFKDDPSKPLFSNHDQRSGITRQLSAFGNCDGGVLLIGVEDNRKVSGVDMKKYSKEYVEERVSSLVQKMCCNFELQRGIHWDLTFSDVSGSESKSIIVVKMAGMRDAGGIFGKCPESYELQCDEDGLQVPHQLGFYKWKWRMKSDDAHLTGNTRGMSDMLSRFQQLRVSEGHLLTVRGDVQRIRDAFFKGDDTFPVSPEGVETSLPAEAQAAIRNIQEVCCRDRYRGFLAVSRSWLRDTGGTAIDSVICDVLLVSRNMGGLHLYTLCDAADEMSFQYSKEAAQSIKKRLSENGARGQKFYVSSHVLPCRAGREVKLPSPDDRYPKSYDLSPREKLNEILKAMVVTLAAVPSNLSSKLGVTFFNLLTTEQFRLVHQQIELNRELWIKGVAGTGKTLVALEFMRELRRRAKLRRDEILYVCENEGIASQVRKTGLCNAICRVTFIDDDFPQTKHVILDEVHNFEQPRGTLSWYEKAKGLVRQHDLDRPGYLWCFIDLCQKSHSFPSGIPEESPQRPHFRLKKVIRNSKKIFKHAKKYLVDEDSKDKAEIGHDFDGEDVETISYLRNKTTELDVLYTTLRRLLEEGYSERDISVLFLKEDSIPSEDRLSEKLNGLSWKSAKDNDSEKIVISSVLKYSGLERPVVVLVNVHRVLYKRHTDSFIFGAVTRAMVKLIIIREG